MPQSFTVDRLGAQGDGVAPNDEDNPVYLPGCLPGERVTADKIVKGRAKRVQIEQQSPDRIDPACAHFGRCGGCRLQHGSADFVAGWKQAQLKQILHGRGLTVDLDPIITVAPATRRRLALQFIGTNRGMLLGLSERESHNLVDLTQCPVSHPNLVALLPALREILKDKGRVSLTLADNGIDVAVKGPDLDHQDWPRLAAFADDTDLARLSWNDELVSQRREPFLALGSLKVPLPLTGFLQASTESDSILAGLVERHLMGAGKIIDLFSGIGTLSAGLLDRASVLAVEGDQSALDAYKAGFDRTPGKGLKPLTVEKRDIFRNPVQTAALNKFDAVIMDPLRAGAIDQAKQLAEADVPRIAYVSCNPVSFAKDAEILVGAGYRLDRLTPVDQFLWSHHIELVAAFSRT